MEAVTVVLTSYSRFDLLYRAIESLLTYNTYPLEEFIIVEDSGRMPDLSRFKDRLPKKTSVLVNANRRTQVAAIDMAYGLVRTPYIFHMEDDWEFYAPGVIEASMEILACDPKIISVWVPAHNDLNKHPMVPTPVPIPGTDRHYFRLQSPIEGKWCGFTFTPGLRRTKDYTDHAPYVAMPADQYAPTIGQIKPCDGAGVMAEISISDYYRKLGFVGAVTQNVAGFARGIGKTRHIKVDRDGSTTVNAETTAGVFKGNPGKGTVYIVTCCSRPENLPAIRASLKPDPRCKWVVIYDEGVAPVEGMGDIQLFCPVTAVRGITRAKNCAIEQLPLQADDWLFYLDDDNIMHPNWYSVVPDLCTTGSYNVITWGVCRPDGSPYCPPSLTFKVGYVDTASYTWRYGFRPEARYVNEECEDGKMAVTFGGPSLAVNADLGYYNYLRPVQPRPSPPPAAPATAKKPTVLIRRPTVLPSQRRYGARLR